MVEVDSLCYILHNWGIPIDVYAVLPTISAFKLTKMLPFNHFTTKAKEAIRRAHELAIERGQNHVNPMHLLAALILQEESMVTSILEKMEAMIREFTVQVRC